MPWLNVRLQVFYNSPPAQDDCPSLRFLLPYSASIAGLSPTPDSFACYGYDDSTASLTASLTFAFGDARGPVVS